MTSHEIEELIYDTLYYRRMVPDTCLQANLAGQELEQQSADVLPQIEHVISTVVVPASTQVREHPFPGSSDTWYEEDSFPGLSGLLGAYMLIASKHDATRAVGFMHTLTPAFAGQSSGSYSCVLPKNQSTPHRKRSPTISKCDPMNSCFLSFRKHHNQRIRFFEKTQVWAMSFFPL